MSAHISALDAIGVFTIGAAPEEVALKARLLRAQAVASTRAAYEPSMLAGHAYWMADQLCRDWLPRRGAGLDDLQEVIKGVTWLFLTAGLVNRLESPDVR